LLDTRSTRQALRTRQRARRHHHLEDHDWTDSVYKAYLTVIGVSVPIFYLAPLLGDTPVSPDVLSEIQHRGPAIVGLVLAVTLALGLRSGSRGGPLGLEPADVTYVMLAPVARGPVLRNAALRQLRGVLYAGGVAGVMLGYLAHLRLRGDLVEWLVAASAVCILIAIATWGAALIGSGLRISRRTATFVGVLLVVWAGIDIGLEITTSPTSLLGRIGLAPLDWSPVAVIGAVAALVVPAIGLAVIGGLSLEAAQRRAGLVGQLRFAATMQDVRTVMVLHRQLSQELPRETPRWRMPGRIPSLLCWQRDWQGVARWPLTRIVRSFALGVISGLALAAVWEGALAFLLVAGPALFLVGLDVAEGLGEETDHSERPAGYPHHWGDLILHHLVVPWCCTVVVLVVTAGVVFAVTASTTALAVTALVLVPVAIAAAVAAAAALVLGAPSAATTSSLGFSDLGPVLLIARQVFPPVLVILSLVPVAIAQQDAKDPVGAAFGFVPIALVVVFGVGFWLRSRRLGVA
jgi:hypothetical protein